MGQSIGTLFPLRWRLWVGKRLFRELDRRVVRVSWHRVIKGPCDSVEVEAMQYVAAHTTVPIPKLHAVHTEDQRIFIETAYVPGDTLQRAWRKLSTNQRHAVFADLKKHISSLRALEPLAQDLVASALQNQALNRPRPATVLLL